MGTGLMILTYFLGAVGATGGGILYWMAMENMKDTNHQMMYVNLLSIFLSPFGAWIITHILHMRRMSALAALSPKSD